MVALLAVGTFAATFGFWLGSRWQVRRRRRLELERDRLRDAAVRAGNAVRFPANVERRS